MKLEDLPNIEFDLIKDSNDLKQMVGKYSSDLFLADIAQLAIMESNPRINMYPFQGLDSPYRQLAYLASLNISSSLDEIAEAEVNTDEDWKNIVVQSIKVRGGYYEEMLPEENEEDLKGFNELYQISLPVFNNYFDSSQVNFEEQELNKIKELFIPFDIIIEEATGLKVDDYLSIFDIIDNQISTNIKAPVNLLVRSSSVKEESIKNKGTHPRTWNYKGDNQDVLDVIDYFTNRKAKFTLNLEELYSKYDKEKLDLFLNEFSIKRETDENYVYYTQPNKILLNPIFSYDGKYLVVFLKQISHSIFRRLYNVVDSSTKRESFFGHRGKWLQDKTVELLDSYFKGNAHIYNEYKVNGKGQDVLLLHKGLALIIENKAHNEVPFSGVPNVLNIYKQYYSRFKKSIQKGYDQCWRVKDQFYFEDKFNITNDKGETLYEVTASKYPNVFSIVITLDNFRDPQINTSKLIKLNEDDDKYPLSMNIDDFEILILTLEKLKIPISTFTKYLHLREDMQGRLLTQSELDIWATFIQLPKFSIPKKSGISYSPGKDVSEIYEDLYKTGLGMKNERNIAMKKSGTFRVLYNFKNRIPVPNNR